jgi:hypothetical protein
MSADQIRAPNAIEVQERMTALTGLSTFWLRGNALRSSGVLCDREGLDHPAQPRGHLAVRMPASEPQESTEAGTSE